MPKLLGLHSLVRFYNKESNAFETVEVIGFGRPPIIRVTRPDTFKKEDRVIEIKESDITSIHDETGSWRGYPNE